MTSGTIFDIKRFAIHDGPGIRTTVFLKGCPLSCAWCHNPESQGKPDTHTTLRGRPVGQPISVSELLSRLLRDRPFFEESGGGVTISGGEPLMQPDFAAELLAGCRATGIATALDTSGFGDPDALDTLLPHTDLVLFDLKVMDSEQHRKWTGVSNELILENLARLASAGTTIWARIPLVPGVTDTEENLDAIVTLVRAHGCIRQVHLLPYHPLGAAKHDNDSSRTDMPPFRPPNADEIETARSRVARCGRPVHIGG